MGHYNFKKDLKKSEESVKKVADYLASRDCTDIEFNHDNRYDISYKKEGNPMTLEVKEDFQYNKTGNVAIEIKSRGKASGICTTKADRWCYVLGEEIWFANPADIKLFLIQHWDRYRRVNGGDNDTSIVALLKLEDFKEVFRKMT